MTGTILAMILNFVAAICCMVAFAFSANEFVTKLLINRGEVEIYNERGEKVEAGSLVKPALSGAIFFCLTLFNVALFLKAVAWL